MSDNKPKLTEYVNGAKRWHLNNELHREDGPAVEYADGEKQWCLNGKFHREDGPAIEYANGAKYWYINNIEYSEPQFNLFMTLKKLGYNDKVVSLLVESQRRMKK